MRLKLRKVINDGALKLSVDNIITRTRKPEQSEIARWFG